MTSNISGKLTGLLLAGSLLLTVTAYADPTLELQILNATGANGEIIVMAGEDIEVGFNVTLDTASVLSDKDTLELVDVALDTLASSKNRGNATSGSVILSVPDNIIAGQFYVRYVRGDNGSVVTQVSHPADVGSIPLVLVQDNSAGGIPARVTALELTDPVPGPEGPIGLTGPQGPQGDPGADGASGLPGADGADGADGTPGLPGADGADGADGTPGLPGADGEDGAPGLPGADGADGASGLPGADGADGAPGEPGSSIHIGQSCEQDETVVGFDIFGNILCAPITASHRYMIGDTGPAGGIVFYVTDERGIHGLEVAPAIMTTSSVWGCQGTLIGTSSGIGTGGENTAKMLALCPGQPGDIFPPPAGVIPTYNGFSGWYLPSILELLELYGAHEAGLLNAIPAILAPELFWSSSEAPFGFDSDSRRGALFIPFAPVDPFFGSEGNIAVQLKSKFGYWRAIRDF
jgi:hypothetical protein